MTAPIQILLVEDSPTDAELIQRQLRKSGFQFTSRIVANEADLLRALAERPDVILSDYDLPQFNGLRALALAQAHAPSVPFVLISGTIGEDIAVEAMRLGALDYLLKDRLVRLGPAVERALEQGRLRQEREQALQSLRLFRTLVDQSSDAFEVLDLATAHYVDVNDCACRDLGYPRADLLRMRVMDVDPGSTDENWPRFAAQLRESGQASGEARHRRRDGSLFPVEYSSRYVRLDREYVVSVVRNISAREEAKRALLESEERFRQMAENIDEVFWMTDLDKQRILYVSPGFERIWGRPRLELYAHPQRWIEAIVPEDRERVRAAALTKQAAGEYHLEYRIVRPDGAIRWILDRAFPIRNEAGVVYRVVGVARDVTEQKRLEEQFLRAQRVEAVGTLAGGVAHDLNNILAPVLMIAGLLKGRAIAPADLRLVDMLESSAKRGAGIVRQLLTYSRGGGGAKVLVQLRHLMKEMDALMRETFPREITIATRCPVDLDPVLGDPTQLHQVLMNLCVNARDAMPRGGELVLAAEPGELAADEARGHPGAQPGRHVVVTVQDTGEGIRPENLSRIFDPFFTTKEVGVGTGLGLSTVLGIVKSHGGIVRVESAPGRGARFEVWLPVSPQANGADATAVAAPGSGRRETILLVDDESAISLTTKVLLERNNYQVVVANNGREALERFVEYQEVIDLVLTDLMMPVMGGTALIRALRNFEPGLRIVATTGFGPEQHMAELKQLGVTDLLFKPCEPAQLLQVLRRLLDTPRPPSATRA